MFQTFLQQLQQASLLEWIAFVFGVLQVLLAIKNSTINFYAGIISVSIYTVVFYRMGLYAESVLNLYYLIVSVQGIFIWQKNISQPEIPISMSNKKNTIHAISIFSISFIVLLFVLKKYTSSNVPILDSLVTSLAFVGTWLLAKRKLENWLWLTVSNVIAIPLQFYKGMELTSLLTTLFLLLGIVGYFKWRNQLKGKS